MEGMRYSWRYEPSKDKIGLTNRSTVYDISCIGVHHMFRAYFSQAPGNGGLVTLKGLELGLIGGACNRAL